MTQLHELHEYFRISMEKSSFYFKSCISKCPHSQQGNQWWQIPRPPHTCQWLAMHTPLKSKMELLTIWHTLWCHEQLYFIRHDELIVVMKYFWLFHEQLFREQNIMNRCFWSHNEIFDVITCFWCHSELFDVMTCFDFMTNVFTSWQMFLHHDIFFTSWQIFDVMTNVFTSWHVFDFMINFLTSWRLFDIMTNVFLVMTNFLFLWHVFFILWQTCWRHGEIFDFMMYFSHHDLILWLWWWTVWRFDVFLTSQQTFWRYDMFLISWRIFDIMINFWYIFDVMTNALTSWRLFDFMTNPLTSWQTLWRHDVVSCNHELLTSWLFWTSWRTCWRHDVFLILW